MIIKQNVGKAIKNAFGVAASVAVMVLPYLPVDKIVRAIKRNGDVTYGDAIGAITNSSMASVYAREVIPLIPTDGSSDFYKAVIAIVESSMPSVYMKDSIADLCNKEVKETE